MPRHLTSDAHEWINEIPTVPIYYLAKPQPRERAWRNQRGKKTLKQVVSKLVVQHRHTGLYHYYYYYYSQRGQQSRTVQQQQLVQLAWFRHGVASG